MRNILIAAALCITACRLEPLEPPGPVKILFVGNSQTFVNDVPGMVKEMAAIQGVEVETTDMSVPNYSLEDHWNDGVVQQALDKQKFNHLVAQQGSSALPESQVLLKDFARRFADQCRKNEVDMNLYMVWPMKHRAFDFENVIFSYTEAAKHAGASLSAAGLAWTKVWEREPNLEFYAPDGLHASKKGSILAAMCVYASVFNKTDLNFLADAKLSWKHELSEKELKAFLEVMDEIY
jgi:hypothetical protein